MKKIHFALAIVAFFALSAFAAVQSLNWKIQEGYAIKFSGNDAEGIFNSLKGTILFDPADLAASKFDVSVAVNSINTGNGLKNKHAKSDKWFDAEKFPNIHFVSTSITKTATNFEATGTLDMHGVQKEVVIPFIFVDNTFKGIFEVKRMDYGIGTEDGMSAKVAPVLKIEIVVPVAQ